MSFDSDIAQITHRSAHDMRCGTVFKKTIGTYTVHADGLTVVCAISNKLRKELIFPIADPTSFRKRVMAVEEIGALDPVAIGDEVRFVLAEDGSGLITEVLPRHSKLARAAAGPKPLEQVIVANCDQVVFVFAAAQPDLKWNLLDRYLVSAESSGLPAVVCITKLDLLDDPTVLQDEVAQYRKLGYCLILTSTVNGEGIEEFRAVIRNRRSVFAGKSGVGKTTLLNAIEPGLGLRVNEISQSTGKGRHTTTHLEMFTLQGGGEVVDTPGMREFGLWEAQAEDVAMYFPEMRPLLGKCQFGADCGHASEPGCAIKQAVAQGRISARRYESYRKLAGE